MSEGPVVGTRTWLRIALVWLVLGGLIFSGLTLVQQWEKDKRTRIVSQAGSTSIELQRARDGHFFLVANVRGPAGVQEIEFLVDTGATSTSVPQAVAEALRLPGLGYSQFSTANGTVQGSLHLADLVLPGNIEIRKLRVAALPNMQNQALLGMDVLGRFHMVQQGRTLNLSVETK